MQPSTGAAQQSRTVQNALDTPRTVGPKIAKQAVLPLQHPLPKNAISNSQFPSGSQQPPPFLTKLFDFVEAPDMDHLVSWNKDNASFTVHNSTEFSTSVLPRYFKHNNFSSFVRQLNQYGFHKVDPDKWSFAHECFRRDRKDLLADISRKRAKPAAASSVGPYGAAGRLPLQKVEPRMSAGATAGDANYSAEAVHRRSLLGDGHDHKAVVELGNYGIVGELEVLRRDKDLLLNELMITRQQESKLKQKADAAEKRIETLERNMNKMQQFIFHFYSHILSSYPNGNARTRRRLTGAPEPHPQPASSSFDGVPLAPAAPVPQGLVPVQDPATAGKELALVAHPPSQTLPLPLVAFPPAYVQEIGSQGQQAFSAASTSAAVAGTGSGSSAEDSEQRGKKKRKRGVKETKRKRRGASAGPDPTAGPVSNHSTKTNNTQQTTKVPEEQLQVSVPVREFAAVPEARRNSSGLASGASGNGAFWPLVEYTPHTPDLNDIQGNEFLGGNGVSNSVIASTPPLDSHPAMIPPPSSPEGLTLGNNTSMNAAAAVPTPLQFDVSDLDLPHEDDSPHLSLDMFPPLTSVPPGTDMESLIRQIQAFEDPDTT
eukprot:CAMPEP_0185846214 /NCGR_PEP_ID=MMETSP1354-20130828/1927_1 /TAXON_ID=708628 /ORGANISM="Erythrolobus madagascarensis, Strain CCMP3276" /LENGTH=598 /DNA_ID=CAMNT_0028546313 /DNA_START=105 /DNA_END=1901 /DNA_ORIENTATION=+